MSTNLTADEFDRNWRKDRLAALKRRLSSKKQEVRTIEISIRDLEETLKKASA